MWLYVESCHTINIVLRQKSSFSYSFILFYLFYFIGRSSEPFSQNYTYSVEKIKNEHTFVAPVNWWPGATALPLNLARGYGLIATLLIKLCRLATCKRRFSLENVVFTETAVKEKTKAVFLHFARNSELTHKIVTSMRNPICIPVIFNARIAMNKRQLTALNNDCSIKTDTTVVIH